MKTLKTKNPKIRKQFQGESLPKSLSSPLMQGPGAVSAPGFSQKIFIMIVESKAKRNI